MNSETYISKSEAETVNLGSKFAERLKDGDIVAFYGGLGAGKTQFIKGICQYFNIGDIATSPTFTIINLYTGELYGQSGETPDCRKKTDELSGQSGGTPDCRGEFQIYHIDLFRIKSPSELPEIGFLDIIYSESGIKLIEWAEKAELLKSEADYSIYIQLSDTNEEERIITIEN